MSRLPTPTRSRALFIGVDSFESLEDLPAVERNLSTLVDLFADDVWELGASHCTQLLNPASVREMDEAIFRTAEAASDTLLLYYAGHGLLDRKGRLHLALPDSNERSVHSTAFPYDWVRMGLAASSAQRCIVILDCCFSARAMGLQASPSSMVELAEAEGTYVLAAAAENAFALAPPGEAYTAFTGALVGVLSDGIADAPQLLDLDTVFMGVQSILRRQGRPDPQCLGRNQIGRTPFAKNPAYLPDQAYNVEGSIHGLHLATSLADTIQTVAEGAVSGLGYELASVHLVRPDGDLVAAALAGTTADEDWATGQIDSRASWDRLLNRSEAWGDLRFLPHSSRRARRFEDEWHPADRLFAPMYTPGASGHSSELIAVLSVDRPRNGRRPNQEQREALQSYAFHAGLAFSNSRLRANMQRALVRLEREQQALRASEESFRQAFENAPSGMAIVEMGGDQHGRILRTNDALCRLLGRPASAIRRYSFSDLVHPEDISTLLRTSAEGGRAELRLCRRDNTYVWVSLRNSVVADAADGPRFLLTHVEDIEERKRRELQLLHQVSHDALTGLPNATELRLRLSSRLCDDPHSPAGAGWDTGGTTSHMHLTSPENTADHGAKGLAVLVCDLDGFKSINDRFGHHTGDMTLIEVARRLTGAVPDGGAVIARIGGNEFAIVTDGLTRAEAQDLALRLRNAIIPPITVDGQALRVGASFGIGWAHCGPTADEVLKSADEQMYVEKRSRPRQHRPAG